MEITDIGPRHLVLEEKPPLARLLLVSIAGAGLLLTLGTMKEYGWQSWYRLTYWLGALVAVVAGLGWVFWGRSTRSILHLDQRRLRLRRRRGLWAVTETQLHLNRIQAVELEAHPHRPRYRLRLALDDHTWCPLSARYSADREGLQAIVARLQAYLAAGKADQAS